MSYLELTFSPVQSEEDKSILMAELLEIGFGSFIETEDDLLAYIPADKYYGDLMKEITFLRQHQDVKIHVRHLEDKNWNEEWEKNYQPVTIGRCHVRAPFHPSKPGAEYDIIINPGMAFGTAHHETTQLMARWLMELDVVGKDILDMGCGTGILAILANKMGAGYVTAIDNDEWAWRNCLVNFSINGVEKGKAVAGDASLIHPENFDLILANINRNVLLQDMKAYYEGLRKGGRLLLSGFYKKDIKALSSSAAGYGLHDMRSGDLNDWAVLLFYK